MRYIVTDQFTKISQTSGTIQNISNIFAVEVSDKAEPDSGFLLFPLNKISFADKSIYLRCTDAGGQAEIRVTPFAVDSGGTSGGGSSVNVDDSIVATDEQIDDMLDDLFPNP